MTFDEGTIGVSGFDFDSEKGRLKALMEEKGIGWEELCRQAALDSARAGRALERGTEGFPESYITLQSLMAVLENLPPANSAPSAAWTRLKQLVWKFAYKNDLPLAEGREFEAYMRTFFGNQRDVGTARYRSTPPASLVEIAEWYKRFKGPKNHQN